jgi:hypothetical protein
LRRDNQGVLTQIDALYEYQREQPHDPRHAGFIGELSDEASEVHLRLLARWRLKAHLEWLGRVSGLTAARYLFTAV